MIQCLFAHPIQEKRFQDGMYVASMAHPKTPSVIVSILQEAAGYEKGLLRKIGDSDRKTDRR